MAVITALELKQEFYRCLSEDSSAAATTASADNPLYPRATVLAYLNQAQRNFVERIAGMPGSNLFRASASASLTTGNIALPSDYMTHLQVVLYYNSARVREIQESSELYLDQTQPQWRDQTATLPTSYLLKQDSSTAPTMNIVAVPAPVGTIASAIRFYYTAAPTDLSADTDNVKCLFNFQSIQRTVLVYDVLGNMLHFEAGEEDDRSEYFRNMYERQMATAYRIAKRLSSRTRSTAGA